MAVLPLGLKHNGLAQQACLSHLPQSRAKQARPFALGDFDDSVGMAQYGHLMGLVSGAMRALLSALTAR